MYLGHLRYYQLLRLILQLQAAKGPLGTSCLEVRETVGIYAPQPFCTDHMWSKRIQMGPINVKLLNGFYLFPRKHGPALPYSRS